MTEEKRKNTATNAGATDTHSGNRGSPSGGRDESRQGGSGPAQNLSPEDKARAGERSAQVQNRDEEGQLAGRDTEDGHNQEGGEGGKRSDTNARRGQGSAESIAPGGKAGPGNPNDADRERSGGKR